jgi:RNA polymerase sigma-70 factor (ECF subfamily)
MKTNMETASVLDSSLDSMTHQLCTIKGKVIHLAQSYLNSREEAEDVFQDIYLKILSAHQRGFYLEGGKARAWILQITRNHCTDLLRRAKNKKHISQTFDVDIFDFIPSNDANILQQWNDQEIKNQVIIAFKSLPDEQRKVMYYRIYMNYSFKEIAEICDISVNTALGRMRYAMINLRKIFDGNKP